MTQVINKVRRNLGNIGVYAILIPLAIIWVFPFILMISTSLKERAQVYEPGILIPNPIMWENYRIAWTEFLPFTRFLINSLIVSGGVVVGAVLCASFVAYGFAKLRFPGRDILFIIMLSTMMMPFAVRMIPLFVIYRNLKWINTFLPLIAPFWVGGMPIYIFLMRQFYKSVPDELIEAAKVDGASHFRIWWQIMIPSSIPVLTVIAVMSFQYSWNQFLEPLIFLNKTSMYTATLGLYNMLGGQDEPQEWHYLMANTIVTTLPVILVYYISQRNMIKGITVSGVKG